jgi:hypothetical protein
VAPGGEWGGEGREVAGVGELEVSNGDMCLLLAGVVVDVAGWKLLFVSRSNSMAAVQVLALRVPSRKGLVSISRTRTDTRVVS